MKTLIFATLLLAMVGSAGLAGFAQGAVPDTKDPAAPATVPATAEAPAPKVSLDLGGGIALEAVLIPAGKFLMGRPPADKDKETDRKQAAGTYKGEYNPKYIGVYEYPQHEVIISKAYYLGTFEVTNEQFEKVMGYNPSSIKDAKNPADGGGQRALQDMKKKGLDTSQIKTGPLAWTDAQQFCQKVSVLTGKVVRLPTEAEWEYAARAGGPPIVFDKDMMNEVAWCSINSENKAHPVGQKKPNAWGLYDLFGNVYEWTENWFAPYTADAVVDPRGPEKALADCPNKVVRGGCFYSGPGGSWTTYKFTKPAEKFSRSDIGFRVLVEVPKPAVVTP
ncbi:MAG: formylglycine-generating enzyme family protein [bacterium]